MAQPPPPQSPYSPPRAGRFWVGRRAKVAVRAERTGNAFGAVILWFLAALVPGLPFFLRGKRTLGWIALGAYVLAFVRFIIVHQVEARLAVRYSIPIFGVVEYEPVFLWFGLAAGIHIASVMEHLRPVLQARLVGFEWRRRLLVTVGASLVVATLVYSILYAPLL